MRVILAVGAALALSACAPLATVIPVAVGAYCVSVSETGKQAIRDVATGGVQIVSCDPVGGEN